MADEPMIDERLAQIRQRVEAASIGPWSVVLTDSINTASRNTCDIRNGNDWSIVWVEAALQIADLLFITYAREDIPILLAEIERLHVENAAMRAAR